MDERYCVSIDLGTSKFGICVARVKGDDVQVVYYKETPSAGIRDGVVQDPTKATASLKKAIEAVENELMVTIYHVVVGMPLSPYRMIRPNECYSMILNYVVIWVYLALKSLRETAPCCLTKGLFSDSIVPQDTQQLPTFS